MPWFNVDDSFYDHPKVWDAPDCAVALWCRAGSWSARSPRRGFVPSGMPARLCGDPEAAVRELLERGLWLRTKGGYLFHDWDDWNLSSEEVKRKREQNAERQRRYRESAGKGDSPAQEDVTLSVTRYVTQDKRVSNAPQSNPIQSPRLVDVVSHLSDRYARILDDDELLKAVIRSIHAKTARTIGAEDARRIAADILAAAKHQVSDPAAYVTKAIRGEKDPIGRWFGDPAAFQPSMLMAVPDSAPGHPYEPGPEGRCQECRLPEANQRHPKARKETA
jgi:hypothetical protein